MVIGCSIQEYAVSVMRGFIKGHIKFRHSCGRHLQQNISKDGIVFTVNDVAKRCHVSELCLQKILECYLPDDNVVVSCTQVQCEELSEERKMDYDDNRDDLLWPKVSLETATLSCNHNRNVILQVNTEDGIPENELWLTTVFVFPKVASLVQQQ